LPSVDPQEARVLVVSRYRVAGHDRESFRDDARQALAALGAQPGFLGGDLGPALDDEGLWVMATRWVGVGAYRRALSAYDVKLRAVPVMLRALDEPSAFEVLDRLDGGDGGAGGAGAVSTSVASDRAPDAATAAPGDRRGH
jgi:quinol monooxygenase YgiN